MRVIAGISGGVDSAVASAILVEEGHDVIGAYLRLNKYNTGEERALETAERIGIPLVVIPAEDAFKKEVEEPFLEAYRSGSTPNPCVICNERVKFAFLFSVAGKYGADLVATGHYARTAPGPRGESSIFRGLDPSKDQSYMLYRVPHKVIDKMIFPLGGMKKSDVREKGSTLFPGLFKGIPESEDLCFVSRKELGEFIREKAGPFPGGRIVKLSGDHVGFHKGLHRYTVGQRKGLALSGGPWYVCAKNLVTNELVVGKEEDIKVRVIKCGRAVWHENPVAGVALSACHRYRSSPLGCILDSVKGSTFSCMLHDKAVGVACGQSLVLYSNDRVYGGGIIEGTWRGGASDDEQ